MVIRILLADDHKIIREGLRSLIESEKDIQVVAEAEDGRQALSLVREFSPNVVVVDVAMPGLNGIETARRIARDYPRTSIIALSMHSDRRLVGKMLAAGASGYLLKDCAFEELANAIRTVAAGRTYLSSMILDIMVRDYFNRQSVSTSAMLCDLTDREREVLQFLAEGNSVKRIATQLHITTKTVETHRERIMQKLGLRSVAELTKYAIKEGLTSLEL